MWLWDELSLGGKDGDKERQRANHNRRERFVMKKTVDKSVSEALPLHKSL